MIHYPDYPADWTPLANDAADAAHQGSPMSMFAKGGRAGCMPFEIKMPKEHVEKMAKGGLAQQAKNVRDAGVGGDTMVIHINKDEYKKLCQEWGDPTINPHTGMPQFTPFWKQSWFAPVAALAGTALMATGVGSALGGALLGEAAGTIGGTTLAGATGISGLGSATLGTLAGNAALSAGIGGLTGGGKGALTSGLLGAAGTVGASALGNYLGAGTPSSVTTGTPSGTLQGAGGYSNADLAYLNAGADNILQNNEVFGGNLVDKGTSGMAFNVEPAAAASKGSGMMSGITGYLTDPNKMAAAAVGLGSLMGGGGPEQPGMPSIPAGAAAPTDPNLMRRLETAPLNRTRLAGPIDYYNYGMRPQAKENRYYEDVAQQPVQAAHGGPLSHYVQGGGTGRSDSIDAKLSDGEYVLDAETVALLGDGSSKAGAQRLDQFRANIRKQKGKALSQGKFSPDARAPEQYLMGGRA
jgi:hypothetical protein